MIEPLAIPAVGDAAVLSLFVRAASGLSEVRTPCIHPTLWTGVWICPSADGHIQATGRDVKGRKQYRYHARFREVRESTKYEHVVEFAEVFQPSARRFASTWPFEASRARKSLLPSFIFSRPPSSGSAMTTMRDKQQLWPDDAEDPPCGCRWKRGAVPIYWQKRQAMVAACERSPDRQDHQGMSGPSRSGAAAVFGRRGKAAGRDLSDVNAYLKEITGKDITAKDFRTWAGTVLAAMALNELKSFDSAAQAKRNFRAAIENVAARLGNTRAPARCAAQFPTQDSSGRPRFLELPS